MKITETEFEKLFKENQAKLKSFIYRLVANSEDVEDLSQETFLKAYKNLEYYKAESTFKTWLFAIANNLIKDHFHAQKRWTRNAQDNCSQSIKNSSKLQQQVMDIYFKNEFDIKNHIDYCFTCVMKYLPLERHTAIMLADIYDFKVAEIAKIMDKPLGGIKHLLHKGRKTMKDVFSEDCTLIHKTGACWKCSELSNTGNSKAETQRKIAELEMVKEKTNANATNLYKMRAALIKGIDPLQSNNFLLHDFLLNQTNAANGKTYPKVEKACKDL
ncbi:MAG: sigma-70 family RNA polymerase sigma factor [Cytophagales bacterium]|nr:sigma-70 family RNA polymerase sigma factor [Cytophagales bacterium]